MIVYLSLLLYGAMLKGPLRFGVQAANALHPIIGGNILTPRNIPGNAAGEDLVHLANAPAFI